MAIIVATILQIGSLFMMAVSALAGEGGDLRNGRIAFIAAVIMSAAVIATARYL